MNPANEQAKSAENLLPQQPDENQMDFPPNDKNHLSQMDIKSQRSNKSKVDNKSYSRYNRSSFVPFYDENQAVELEKLDPSSFKPQFYEQMQSLNYDRFIDQEKYRLPTFLDPE
mmetsp:Transcript_10531/g.17666  ORF Transcript_10531/g.17666 Transcript_10531/m.17666 type:complete len:114 (-) Transcript_10531:83-424(-)